MEHRIGNKGQGIGNKGRRNARRWMRRAFWFLVPCFMFLVLALPVAAQVDTGLDTVESEIVLSSADPRIIVARIIRTFLGLLGVVGLGVVLYGGVLWMTANGKEETVTKAKKVLMNGAIGLFLVLASFSIAQFVLTKLVDATGAGGGGGGGLVELCGDNVDNDDDTLIDEGCPVPPDDPWACADNDNNPETPHICKVQPLEGPMGTYVTMYGTGFGTYDADVSVVRIGEVTARIVACGTTPNWSDTLVVAAVPTDGGLDVGQQYPVALTNASGNVEIFSDGLTGNFTVTDGELGPQIACIVPNTGSEGTAVDVQGDHFGVIAADVKLRFTANNRNTVDAQPDTVTVTQFNVAVPVGAITGEARVARGGVLSNPYPFTVSCSSHAQCGVSNCCAANRCVDVQACVAVDPVITSIDPEADGFGAYVTITGQNFGTSTGRVRFSYTADVRTCSATAVRDTGGHCSGTATACTSDVDCATAPKFCERTGGPCFGRFDCTLVTSSCVITACASNVAAVQGRACTTDADCAVSGEVVGTCTAAGAKRCTLFSQFASPVTCEQRRIEVGEWCGERLDFCEASTCIVGEQETVTLGACRVSGIACVSDADCAGGAGDTCDTTQSARCTADSACAAGDAQGTCGPSQSVAREYEIISNFPGQCTAVGRWTNTSVLARIPDVLSGWSPIGTTQAPTSLDELKVRYDVRLERDDGVLSRSPHPQFTVTDDAPGPGICALQPSTGARGSTIAIHGERFGATRGTGLATIGSIALNLASAVWSDRSIAGAIVPQEASTGPRDVVVRQSGQESNARTFTVQADTPPSGLLTGPVIAAVSPAHRDLSGATPTDVCALRDDQTRCTPNGAVGNFVTISGQGFGATPGTVTIAGIAASAPATCSGVAAWSDTAIIVAVPSGITAAGPVVVTVGAESDATNDTRGVAIPDFVVTSVTRPGLCSASSQIPGERTLIAGSGLVSVTTVHFGSGPHSTSNLQMSGAQLSSFVPLSLAAPQQDIPLFAVDGAGERSNAVPFDLLVPQRTVRIDAIEPAAAPPGTVVTIRGANFGEQDGIIEFTNSDGAMYRVQSVWPTQCAAMDDWTDTQVLLRVPPHDQWQQQPGFLRISSAEQLLRPWNVRIVPGAGGAQVNGAPYPTFTVTNGAPLPSICSMTPVMGPVGT
ncbi:MAG: IPT/TIG domain-containing protein, partial [bacterium]|nr:IPT/TIG domain-containing protein [bacterium]